MSNKLPWMPFDIPAYRNDTGHLTTLQHGAYMLLLMHYWCHGPLPDDDEQLAATARMDAKAWRANQKVIRQFFRQHNGELHQKRADAERDKAADISAKRRGAANARHNPPANAPPNRHANASANAPPHAPSNGGASGHACGPHTVPVTESVPSTEKRKKVNKIPFLGEEMRARGSREQNPVPDRLAELLAEEGIEPPNSEPEDVPNVIDILDAREAAKAELGQTGAVGAQIRRAAKALAMRIPYAEVRSVDAQLDALSLQPAAVGADATMGLRWAPAEPVRSVEEQRAALLAGCTPDQIARAQRYAARYAS